MRWNVIIAVNLLWVKRVFFKIFSTITLLLPPKYYRFDLIKKEQISRLLQVNDYKIVVNFFHISNNLTWYLAIVHEFTRIYPVCWTYELKETIHVNLCKNCAIDLKKNNLYWKLSQGSFFGRIQETIFFVRDLLTFTRAENHLLIELWHQLYISPFFPSEENLHYCDFFRVKYLKVDNWQ